MENGSHEKKSVGTFLQAFARGTRLSLRGADAVPEKHPAGKQLGSSSPTSVAISHGAAPVPAPPQLAKEKHKIPKEGKTGKKHHHKTRKQTVVETPSANTDAGASTQMPEPVPEQLEKLDNIDEPLEAEDVSTVAADIEEGEAFLREISGLIAETDTQPPAEADRSAEAPVINTPLGAKKEKKKKEKKRKHEKTLGKDKLHVVASNHVNENCAPPQPGITPEGQSGQPEAGVQSQQMHDGVDGAGLLAAIEEEIGKRSRKEKKAKKSRKAHIGDSPGNLHTADGHQVQFDQNSFWGAPDPSKYAAVPEKQAQEEQASSVSVFLPEGEASEASQNVSRAEKAQPPGPLGSPFDAKTAVSPFDAKAAHPQVPAHIPSQTLAKQPKKRSRQREASRSSSSTSSSDSPQSRRRKKHKRKRSRSRSRRRRGRMWHRRSGMPRPPWALWPSTGGFTQVSWEVAVQAYSRWPGQARTSHPLPPGMPTNFAPMGPQLTASTPLPAQAPQIPVAPAPLAAPAPQPQASGGARTALDVVTYPGLMPNAKLNSGAQEGAQTEAAEEESDAEEEGIASATPQRHPAAVGLSPGGAASDAASPEEQLKPPDAVSGDVRELKEPEPKPLEERGKGQEEVAPSPPPTVTREPKQPWPVEMLDELVRTWPGPARTVWQTPPQLVLDPTLRRTPSSLPSTRTAISALAAPGVGADEEEDADEVEFLGVTTQGEPVEPPPPLSSPVESGGGAESASTATSSSTNVELPLWGRVVDWPSQLLAIEVSPAVRWRPEKLLSVTQQWRKQMGKKEPRPLCSLPPPTPLEPDNLMLDLTAVEESDPPPEDAPSAGNIPVVPWMRPPRLAIPEGLRRDMSRYTGTELLVRAQKRQSRAAALSKAAALPTAPGRPASEWAGYTAKVIALMHSLQVSPAASHTATTMATWVQLSAAEQARFRSEYPQLLRNVVA